MTMAYLTVGVPGSRFQLAVVDQEALTSTITFKNRHIAQTYRRLLDNATKAPACSDTWLLTPGYFPLIPFNHHCRHGYKVKFRIGDSEIMNFFQGRERKRQGKYSVTGHLPVKAADGVPRSMLNVPLKRAAESGSEYFGPLVLRSLGEGGWISCPGVARRA
jgi:hypothetical protein